MYTLIRLHNGATIEAVVLACTQSRMRLAAAGHKDAITLRSRGSDWLDEHHEPVEFGFLLANHGEASEAAKPARVAVSQAS